MESVTTNPSFAAEAPGQWRSGVPAIIGLLAFLAAFTHVRIGSLQPVDIALLLWMGFCIAKFLYSRLSLRIVSGLDGLFKSYMLFLLVLIVLSVLSIRLPFYPLYDVSFLKQPVIFSLSKLLQLAAIICGFLWLANALMTSKAFLTQAMNFYWVTGVASSIYALACCLAVFVLHLVPSGGSLFGAYSSSGVRARGFFNEGGPFGMYLVSVLVIGFLRRYVTGKPMSKVSVVIVAAAFVLSDSKAGILVLALLLLYSVMSAASFARKVSYLTLSVIFLGGAAVLLNVGGQLTAYLYSFENIHQEVATRGEDLNLVAGRISALIIVPKMIAAHPISGIGFGNYPLMRNDPHYLGVLPSIRDTEDLPAIGIPGIAAEIGIPATIWLMVLLVMPYLKGRKAAPIIAIAGIFQFLAHASGVQLTFFYPWFVSACALAAACGEPSRWAGIEPEAQALPVVS